MPRGFATLTPERRREISRLGGKAAHASGRAHQFTTEEAKIAGSKGGRHVSRDKKHMAEIGRRGGESKAAAVNTAPHDDDSVA